MSIIICDLDGVLVNFVEGAYRAHNRLSEYKEGETPTGWDFYEDWGMTEEEFWVPIHAEGAAFWDTLSPYPWSQQIIDLLLSGKYGGFILSTSPSRDPSSWIGKYNWIKHTFGLRFKDYTITECKWKLAHPDALLIDDSDANCEKFDKWDGSSILFPGAWNKNKKLANDPMSYVLPLLDEWYAMQTEMTGYQDDSVEDLGFIKIDEHALQGYLEARDEVRRSRNTPEIGY